MNNIVRGRPPNFEMLAKVFPMSKSKGTIFAYAPNIYVSDGKPLPDSLMAHEQVHLDRQESYAGGPEAWWDRYLTDRQFRYTEELVAHVAEYQYLMENGSRDVRRKALVTVASRLSSSLYSLGISQKQALDAILANHF